MNKESLSKRIAELYGVPASKYATGLEDVWLIDDTARMFELAVEHFIHIKPYENTYVEIDWWLNDIDIETETSIIVQYNDHPTKLEATLWAIGLALVNKAEALK